ncbi:hypothetical protein [Tomitella fengzijianii]|nr:hypothetical protein [Tomitella fengzijianii]
MTYADHPTETDIITRRALAVLYAARGIDPHTILVLTGGPE